MNGLEINDADQYICLYSLADNYNSLWFIDIDYNKHTCVLA